MSGIESLLLCHQDDRTTYRSWVSCWTSSCQCLLALSSALYSPLMCWITFFLSIPCDRETACVMSPAILEMSLDFISRRWKRLKKRYVLKCPINTLKGESKTPKTLTKHIIMCQYKICLVVVLVIADAEQLSQHNFHKRLRNTFCFLSFKKAITCGQRQAKPIRCISILH